MVREKLKLIGHKYILAAKILWLRTLVFVFTRRFGILLEFLMASIRTLVDFRPGITK